jgi:hypothetical protein
MVRSAINSVIAWRRGDAVDISNPSTIAQGFSYCSLKSTSGLDKIKEGGGDLLRAFTF